MRPLFRRSLLPSFRPNDQASCQCPFIHPHRHLLLALQLHLERLLQPLLLRPHQATEQRLVRPLLLRPQQPPVQSPLRAKVRPQHRPIHQAPFLSANLLLQRASVPSLPRFSRSMPLDHLTARALDRCPLLDFGWIRGYNSSVFERVGKQAGASACMSVPSGG